ncbi:MAG: hypothetical protein HY900_19085 [Deltaproteobacteria bacterium]|nr:hypothetical protein [Deltaproteobacteria bacterium]
MNKRQSFLLRAATALVFAAAVFLPFSDANAHCDSLDGPVINDARAALEKGDVTSVLKWVRAGDEGEIKKAFQKTMALRAKGGRSREQGDRSFFETLVRVHRAGEGAPFTGLRQSVVESGPAVVGADQALESGSVEDLVTLLTQDMAEGVRRRFEHARELKAHADQDVKAGRNYVAAYVDYVHYVEALHAAASKAGGHHEHAEHKAEARQKET